MVTRINADLLTEGTYRESLTTFAVGYRGPDYLADLNILAPGVPVANRFDYKAFDNAEAFYSELSDDLRAPRGDFKEVEYTSEEVTAKTANRGLMICVDRDQVKNNPNWEQQYTGMLITRIRLNQLRRAIALLSAGATNANKTWDTTAGRTRTMTCSPISSPRTRRLACGRTAWPTAPTAWSKRVLAHRAQDNAGGYASAGLTPEQVAAFLGIERAIVCNARYSTSASAKS